MSTNLYNSRIVKFLANNTIPKTSTVFKGTLYEYTVMRELEHKFHEALASSPITSSSSSSPGVGKTPVIKNLDIIGGSYDHGIDLVGQLDSTMTKILVQCKCFSKQKVTGKEIRELVGATSMYKTLNSQFESVSILASPNTITKDGVQVMNKIPIPLIYLQVTMLNPEKIDESGQIMTIYENDYSFKKHGFTK